MSSDLKIMSKNSFLPVPGTGQAISSWFPIDLIPQIEELAMARNVSKSTLIRQIVFDFLKTSKDETSAA